MKLTLYYGPTPNARPKNYCHMPGSDEGMKRVGNRLLFEDLAIAGALLAERQVQESFASAA
jgi:hypothetical protein